MSIFLLSITMILLILCIYDTPSSLSRSLYYERMKKQVFKNIKTRMELEQSGKSKEEIKQEIDAGYGVVIIIATIFEILLILYYIKIGKLIGNTTFALLSAMQIASVIYNYFCNIMLNPYSENIEDYKFRRIPLLLNTVLDYIYYISVIAYAIGWYK